MAVQLDILSNVRIASPCEASWSAMHGDDRVRFCDLCKLNVFNISALSRHEAEQLIIEKQGKLCVRYFQRTDGTILTQDCPRGMARVSQAFRRLIFRGAAACLSLFAAITALASMPRGARQLSLRAYDPFRITSSWIWRMEQRIRNALSPQSFTGTPLMGDIAMPNKAELSSLTPDQLAEVEAIAHECELRSPAGCAGMDADQRRLSAFTIWQYRIPRKAR